MVCINAAEDFKLEKQASIYVDSTEKKELVQATQELEISDKVPQNVN